MSVAVPPNVKPATVTVLPFPTFLLAKVPVAPPRLRVTSSAPTTPTSAAPPVFKVADVVPS